MRYRCSACSHELTIASSAAWPERCPYCGAAPLSASSGLLEPPRIVPPLIGAGGGTIVGAQAVADELLEQAHAAGNSAA